MSPAVADALLWLIRISPFIGVAVIVYRMLRAFQRGGVDAGKSARRHVSRTSSPGSFWFEMALHLAFAVFLFLIGLSFVGLAPRWLADVMNG